MKIVNVAACGLLFLCAPALAEDPPADEAPKPVELTISGRAIESPLLKYRLLPTEPELKPGNAAPIILRIPWDNWDFFGSENREVREQLRENKWELMPLDSAEWKEFPVRRVLPDGFYHELKRAAFRRDADWEYPLHESMPYAMLLPDVQGGRELVRGLSARARHHLARGELDQAHECVLVGLAFARHQSRNPFYVVQAVSAIYHKLMLDRIAELIAQPESPNLYWPLSALPDPLLNVRGAAEFESQMFALSFPAANDVDRPRTEAEWKELHEQLLVVLRLASEGVPDDDAMAKITALGKQSLKPAGRAVTDEEARVRWIVTSWMSADERVAAIMRLPPREGLPLLLEFESERDSLADEGTPVVSSIGAAGVAPLYCALRAPDRRVQALRVIEAVRHYVATHDGELPARLDDIREIPVPLDPWTGQPFEWRVEGKTAALKAAPMWPADFPRGDRQFRPETIDFRLIVRK